MKVIFLDIDGVLTSLKRKMKLDAGNISRLGQIIEATDAELVISSSWRRFKLEDTIAELANTSDFRHGGVEFPYCDRIIGHTRRLYCFALEDTEKHYLSARGLEIKRWLKEFGKDFKVENYVILDDDCDMLLEQAGHFVHTDTYKGLSDSNVRKAIKILNRVSHGPSHN